METKKALKEGTETAKKRYNKKKKRSIKCVEEGDEEGTGRRH